MYDSVQTMSLRISYVLVSLMTLANVGMQRITLSKSGVGFPLQRLARVQTALRTNEVLGAELSTSWQILGSIFWSRRASLNLTLSPEMFPRHQMVYSLTSMWAAVSKMLISVGIAAFSISLRTNWLSLDAILVRHQIASNWSLELLTLASCIKGAIRLQSTVLWIGGLSSKERSLRRAVVAMININ